MSSKFSKLLINWFSNSPNAFNKSWLLRSSVVSLKTLHYLLHHSRKLPNLPHSIGIVIDEQVWKHWIKFHISSHASLNSIPFTAFRWGALSPFNILSRKRQNIQKIFLSKNLSPFFLLPQELHWLKQYSKKWCRLSFLFPS